MKEIIALLLMELGKTATETAIKKIVEKAFESLGRK